ncbi:MAG: hypothetical protein ACK5IB_04445, partial [Qingshengfaniella sp.]
VTFVAACGGFQADLDWLKEGWGERAGNFLIRGTPYNCGSVTRRLTGKARSPSDGKWLKRALGAAQLRAAQLRVRSKTLESHEFRLSGTKDIR